jgi:hypothetical protein
MLVDIFIAQIPPTPTVMPVATAPVYLPSVGDLGFWGSTSDLIQMWNQNAGVTTGLQYFILAGLVMAGVFIFVRLIKSINRDDDEAPRIVVNVPRPTRRRAYRRR